MSGFKWLIDQYFQLPRWERIGNLLLLAVVLTSVLLVSFWPQKEISADEIALMDKTEFALLQQKEEAETLFAEKYKNRSGKNSPNYYNNPKGSAFIEDLEKATVNDFQRAGLSKKVAFNLFNYIKKGGKIKSEKDVRKIYGMNDEMANAFLTNIHLPNIEKTDSSTTKKPFIKKEIGIIDLNLADSSQLVIVKGISPKMVPYILKFRKAIGAFHSVEQLNEVFKNPLNNFDEIKKQITVENFKPFIKINSISVTDLKKHKYFAKDNLASTIIAYRDKHGKFNKPEDLKKCVLVTEEILLKIQPYLVFE